MGISADRRLILFGIAGSLALAAVKIATGVWGSSQALIADGVESLTDVVSSLVVLAGVALSSRPPDADHPWGHGKQETFAALLVGFVLLLAAGWIAYQSIVEIRRPHQAPAWFTLPVLVGVVGLKVWLSAELGRRGEAVGSPALRADAWHHLSDAITSGAAFVGICVALAGGPGWEAADDWAALAACAVIAWNSWAISHQAMLELSETMVDRATEQRLREVSGAVEGVRAVEKLRARRSGRGILMEIHIEVDAELTVADGHHLAGCVKHTLLRGGLGVADVVVHVEPHETGRP